MAAKQSICASTSQGECILDVDPTRLGPNPVEPAAQRGEVHQQGRLGDRSPPRSRRWPRWCLPQVSISVADSGWDRARPAASVFDLFAQGETGSSEPGLGIRLALARRLDELHAGRLDARSEGPAEGASSLSNFHWREPIGPPPGEAPREQRLERRVLVVDDDRDAADATVMLIENMGGESRVAFEAKARLRCSRTTNRRWSCSTSG